MGNQESFVTKELTKTMINTFLFEKIIPEMVISRKEIFSTIAWKIYPVFKLKN